MINEELQRLQVLVIKVIQKLENAEDENSTLKAEINGLKLNVKDKEDALVRFKNQIKINKIVNNIPEENVESAELRERINNYINEIDKIVAYLSE